MTATTVPAVDGTGTGAATAPWRRDVTPSVLARRNPTVKLVLLTVVSAAVLLVLDPVTPLVLYALALVGVAAAARVPARTLLVAHGPLLAFAGGVLVVNAVSRPGPVVWSGPGLEVTAPGLSVGTALAARSLLIGVLALGFVRSTDGPTLLASLQADARLPARPAHALLAGYRLLEEMPRTWAQVRHAHAVRAPRRRGGRPALGVRAHGRMVFGLLVSSLRTGERLAATLEQRGLGLGPRTVWRPVRRDRGDVVLALVVLGTLAAVLLVSARLGLLAGPGALTG
ncbi:energy-coupling factor transporter transmembrane component T family protein [Cellulomonas marina]|uniref:Energy-coupling factor transport system permease protein/energy-coupling factor transport system ATP-binding protein n=1 Tax=Cellulomonas marina TaxID=988821 RepID=A0A1I0X8I1_9CELL|nr:energy-coupling factor transporter transmembrane component T [Cellulomonas marina]GIG29479.1 hypothetical protein Cma02nite_20790 [Cellulomonas marina]SFA96736.1 energy-coupling factor transport system permease protein/energy-coupling factor transport system ATP-binding protein [Cellulomonas marina]